MKQLNLFFDCEFVHFQEGTATSRVVDIESDAEASRFNTKLPGLISIGVVSDCGKTFYAENASVQKESCSDFVIETVLPLLEGGEALMPYSAIAEKLKAWIESFDREVKMLSDAPYFDWPHVEHMFSTYGWPSNLNREPAPISFASSIQSTRFFNALEDMFRGNKSLRRHHALDDAIANKEAFKTATSRNY